MIMQELGAVAQFERDFLVERIRQGWVRAKAEAKKLGCLKQPRLYNVGTRQKQAQVAPELYIGIVV